jgi:hypothetical protein
MSLFRVIATGASGRVLLRATDTEADGLDVSNGYGLVHPQRFHSHPAPALHDNYSERTTGRTGAAISIVSHR